MQTCCYTVRVCRLCWHSIKDVDIQSDPCILQKLPLSFRDRCQVVAPRSASLLLSLKPRRLAKSKPASSTCLGVECALAKSPQTSVPCLAQAQSKPDNLFLDILSLPPFFPASSISSILGTRRDAGHSSGQPGLILAYAIRSEVQAQQHRHHDVLRTGVAASLVTLRHL